MNFAQPVFLWTLAALGIPLAIHLLSRKEGRVVKVGSIRHIEASTTSRFKSLRLNELLLLLLRCMMVIWLALFLSGATCTSTTPGRKDGWLLTEPGMDRNQNIRPFIDSLTSDGFEWRTLTTGFPQYDASDSATTAEYWDLASELEIIDRDIVVISYNLMNRFTQKRMALPPNIRWIAVDLPSRNFIAMATSQNGDSLAVRVGHSDGDGTSYSTSKTASSTQWYTSEDGDTAHIRKRDTISVTVIHDEVYAQDARVLKAALRATQGTYGVSIVETSSAKADWTFWMSEEEPSRPINSKTILLRPAPFSGWIARVDKMEWHLTKRITQDEALKAHLAIELAETLLAAFPMSAKTTAHDARALSESMTWSPVKKAGSMKGGLPQATDISIWLIILFGLTWAAERAVALTRNL
jgi:hypothetical protein